MKVWTNRSRITPIKVLLLFLFFPMPESIIAGNKPDTLSFLHITDIHFCNLVGYHPAFAQGRQHYEKVTEPLINFFSTIPGKVKSDFVTITGDAIDFYEGETISGNILGTQIEQFASVMDKINVPVPVYLALGNHDIASYWVDPSSRRIASHQYHAGRARAAWIRNIPCFKDGTYYSLKFQVDTTFYRLIFLDNGYYSTERTDEKGHYIMDPFQINWLENEIRKSDTDVEILFMHMPLFNPVDDDIKPSLNKYLLDLNDTVPINHAVKSSNANFLDIFSILGQTSSPRLILTGHRHSNVIHDVSFSNDYTLTQVMTGAFARDSRNWRLIQLTGESILISFPGDTRIQYQISTKPGR